MYFVPGLPRTHVLADRGTSVHVVALHEGVAFEGLGGIRLKNLTSK